MSFAKLRVLVRCARISRIGWLAAGQAVAQALLGCAISACASGAGVTATPTPDCGLTACGGDLIGQWQVTSGCVQDLALIQDCPAVGLRIASQASGSLSFGADQSYAFDWSLQGEVRVDIPISCTGNAACTDVGASIGAACLDAGAGCSCSTSLQAGHVMGSGSYVSEGSAFTTSDNGVEDSFDYCVLGDTLKFAVHESNGASTVIGATRVH